MYVIIGSDYDLSPFQRQSITWLIIDLLQSYHQVNVIRS